ncbi:MAG: ClpXP protease specificity-enhancing factor [Pseudoxanthomonas sp.]
MTDAPLRMTSHRPYLLRALAEWIADNGMTPHLLVDATQSGVQVPASAVKEGKVVLNIAQRAVSHLVIDNDEVAFSARFGGVSYPVRVPISAVLAIYSRETGQGMALPEDVNAAPNPDGDDNPPPPDAPTPDDTPAGGKRPSFLRVVK